MALSATAWYSRISEELILYSEPSATEKTDILLRALKRFIQKVERPRISASLAVVAGTARYAKPATIRKLQTIRNSDEQTISYTEDTTKNEVVFQSTPGAAATYTVYGTPAEIRTNLDAILSALSEDYEPILWAYISAFTSEWAKEDRAIERIKLADEMAFSERYDENHRLDTENMTIALRDASGKYIGHKGNPQNRSITYGTRYGMDL